MCDTTTKLDIKKSQKADYTRQNSKELDFNCQIISPDLKIIDCKQAIDSLENQVAKRTSELTKIIDILNKEILAHKQSRKTIWESKKRYEELFNSVLAGICINDNDEVIQFCNPAFANIFEENSVADLINRNLLDYVQKDQKQIILSQTENRKKDISSQYELEIITAKGNKKQLDVSVSPRFNNDGLYIGAFGSVIDITERNLAEIKLKESEEIFRGLAEQSPNMIFINWRGKLAYVNDHCVEVMEYTKDEYYGPDFDFRCLIAPESLDRINERFAKYLHGEGSPPTEYTIVTKSGRKIEAVLATRLISYKGDSAVLGIITDITKYKKAEKELTELNIRLETKRSALIGKNIALKEVVDLVENDKKEIAVQIQSNIDKTIMPILGRLLERANPEDKENILLLKNSMEQVTHPFVGKLESQYGKLTPREAEISNMIRIGLSTKDIAQTLNTSWETVRNQRKQIRKKLKISGKKVSLTSFLQTT